MRFATASFLLYNINMKKVIFLDIDGVLNSDCDFGGKSKPNPRVYSDDGNSYCGICKSHVKVLKKIVDRRGAKLVLTLS